MDDTANEIATITDIAVAEYSATALVVRGNTKAYKEELKSLGGKYNSQLRDQESSSGVSPGWIFSKTRQGMIEDFIRTGELIERVAPAREPVRRPTAAAPATRARRPEQIASEEVAKTQGDFREDAAHRTAVPCHCQELRREVQELGLKMDKILNFFEKNEQLRKNVMQGAGNVMKGIFGATNAVFEGAETYDHVPMGACIAEMSSLMPRAGGAPKRPAVNKGRSMAPPSVTLLDEESRDSPQGTSTSFGSRSPPGATAILFEDEELEN